MWIPKLFNRKRHPLLPWATLLVGGWLLLDLGTSLLAEMVWFQEVDYGQVWTTQLLTRSLIGLLVFGASLSVLWFNLQMAERRVWTRPEPEAKRLRFSIPMGLPVLLPCVILISGLIAASLIYYGQVAVDHWRGFNLPIPEKFDLSVVWRLVENWPTQPWQPLLLVGLTTALLVYPRSLLRWLTLSVSLGFALVLSEHWDKVLLAWHRQPFTKTDPLFQTDIGFYIFTLPLWELLIFWLVGVLAATVLAVGLRYLLSGNSLSQGYFPGFSQPQARHLTWLSGLLLLTLSLSYWIDRYKLLYSPAGASYGASYTDATVTLPLYTVLSLAAIPLGLWLLGTGFNLRFGTSRVPSSPGKRLEPVLQSDALPAPRFNTRLGYPRPEQSVQSVTTKLPASRSALFLRSISVPWILAGYVLAMVLGWLLPIMVQRLVVQPNEVQLEQSYLERTIALTRQGFKLDEIDGQTFDPDASLTFADLQNNRLTLENVRLWDKRPLLETNRQLQRIRLYYEFPDADIDRYTLPTEAGGTTQRQVLIAARELDYRSVPAAAQTWVNQHLVYTHGYGFTVSPVNTAGEGGLPDYFIRGIDASGTDPKVLESIPIGKPRIYYGELTDTYVMTQTRMQELDYPSGSENVYNTYDGWGGVHLGNFARRLLFAKYLKDWRMVLTDNFTPQTKLLFRRNIKERVHQIAPFLRYDSDPYLVVADVGNKQWARGYRELGSTEADQAPAVDQSHLYWIIDAYTTSTRYPYSDPLEHRFNYIRNSVKVVIDAYHGSVNFYISDPQDPIIQAWSRVFPGMFLPLAQMPTTLQRHIRYPQDLFQIQSNQLMTYHMTDPLVFYNREDQWRAPNEIYDSEPQLVEPYYLIMKLPIGDSEEFILLRPFTPAQRNNLIAWLAARSDQEQYGKMLLYVFPKQKLVFGPEQIEARINQDPVISERISLWNRRGSRVVQGNLLVIPVEQSLLYVEPLYLVAEQNQLPTLVRVVVAYGNRIVMAETLEQALDAMFSPTTTSETPILRTAEPEIIETLPP